MSELWSSRGGVGLKRRVVRARQLKRKAGEPVRWLQPFPRMRWSAPRVLHQAASLP